MASRRPLWKWLLMALWTAMLVAIAVGFWMIVTDENISRNESAWAEVER